MSVNFHISPRTNLDEAERAVLCTLLYFDIFRYPLTAREILNFCEIPDLSYDEVCRTLTALEQKHIVFPIGKYYSLWNSEDDVARRRIGNELAAKRMKTARFFSRIISSFPFVRSVMLSGSLSKNYMDEKSDIDYFIVTAPGRVWLTRGLLALFKRVFLFNSHRNFCTNYLIASDALEISEKNIYTAVETVTLIPVYGKEVWRKFVETNIWALSFLPNYSNGTVSFISESEPWFKKFLETCLSGHWADWLDNYFMRWAMKRWQKKFGNLFTSEDFELAFRSRRDTSKNHPQFFQKKVLDVYLKKIASFEEEHNLKLTA